VITFKQFLEQKTKETRTVYCDMDGVLVDFKVGLFKVLGKKMSDEKLRTTKIDWALID